MGHAGCADDDGEALVWLVAFGQDAGFDVEEFDLRHDVRVSRVGGFGDGFDEVESFVVGALTHVVVDFEEGEREREFDIWCALAL